MGYNILRAAFLTQANAYAMLRSWAGRSALGESLPDSCAMRLGLLS